MPRILLIYHSRSGNTETIANWIAEAITEEGLEVACKRVEDTNLEELLKVDGLIIGSPTYYGTVSAEIKQFLDASIKYHGKLDGKVGAAFSTAASAGQETTVLSILESLLIHGMIIQGDTEGCHYGVTALGKPGDQDLRRCRRFGHRFTQLVRMLLTQETR